MAKKSLPMSNMSHRILWKSIVNLFNLSKLIGKIVEKEELEKSFGNFVTIKGTILGKNFIMINYIKYKINFIKLNPFTVYNGNFFEN